MEVIGHAHRLRRADGAYDRAGTGCRSNAAFGGNKKY